MFHFSIVSFSLLEFFKQISNLIICSYPSPSPLSISSAGLLDVGGTYTAALMQGATGASSWSWRTLVGGLGAPVGHSLLHLRFLE